VLASPGLHPQMSTFLFRRADSSLLRSPFCFCFCLLLALALAPALPSTAAGAREVPGAQLSSRSAITSSLSSAWAQKQSVCCHPNSYCQSYQISPGICTLHCTVLCYIALYSDGLYVQCSTATVLYDAHCTVQQSTAQHSTAQHSTAQYSTVLYCSRSALYLELEVKRGRNDDPCRLRRCLRGQVKGGVAHKGRRAGGARG